MRKCDKLVEVGRRQFLRGGTLAGVGLAAAACTPEEKSREAGGHQGALLAYPGTRLANIAELAVNEPFDVSYPDEDAPGVLLKLGRAVEGGVGPDGDIVGFSILCPHQGFALVYNQQDRTLNCPGHYSRFDPEAGGQQVWGQASQNLPQYILSADSEGDIYANGIDELLYGRVSNILGGA